MGISAEEQQTTPATDHKICANGKSVTHNHDLRRSSPGGATPQDKKRQRTTGDGEELARRAPLAEVQIDAIPLSRCGLPAIGLPALGSRHTDHIPATPNSPGSRVGANDAAWMITCATNALQLTTYSGSTQRAGKCASLRLPPPRLRPCHRSP